VTLYPAVLNVPKLDGVQSGRATLDSLRALARQALRVSAHMSGLALGELHQDADGAPVPCSSTYWSISHKPRCVAAVSSTYPTGIDVEEVKPRGRNLLGYVATPEEWQLLEGEDPWHVFYRYWTAKEAVLKAASIGIAGMKGCRVKSVPDATRVAIEYQGHVYLVRQLRHGRHIVSVVHRGETVEWVMAKPHDKSAQSAPLVE